MKKLIITLLTIIFAICANAQQNLYVSTGTNVNVRIGPGKQYAVMPAKTGNNCGKAKIQLGKGEGVTFLGERKNGFMKVQSDEKC